MQDMECRHRLQPFTSRTIGFMEGQKRKNAHRGSSIVHEDHEKADRI